MAMLTRLVITIFCLVNIVYAGNIRNVHLVDKVGSNYFFRGALPVIESNTGDTFNYKDLISSLENNGLSMKPKDYNLVVISLLTQFKSNEEQAIEAENQFFSNLPTDVHGQFINHPIYGSLLNHLEGQDDDKQVLPFPDDLPGLVEQIQALLHDKHDKPQVIYVHCHAGCDRTGTVVASYRMQQFKWDINKVWQKNINECGRAPNTLSKNETIKYCEYLNMSDCSI